MKITTWNMLGGIQQLYLGTLINDNQPDVICLQECGDMTAILQNANAIAGFQNSLTGIYQYGLNIYDVVFWYNNVDANPQNSLAVMSRITVNAWGILIPDTQTPVYVPGNPRNLPWMTVNQGGNLITIYSYHGPSAGQANACSYNNPQINRVNNIGGIWAVVGDFNADPTSAGFVNPPAGLLERGDQVTQFGGGLLDYSITNAAGYEFSSVGQLLIGSDHFPQNFTY